MKEQHILDLLFSKQNIEKSEQLEKQKTHLKENILFFLEKDLTNIKTQFENISYKNIEAKAHFEKRSLLEYFEHQRHPIGYCVVKFTTPYNEDKYLLIFRESGSGETRLIGKKGLLGGHIGFEDVVIENNLFNLEKTILKGTLRELEEEAAIISDLIISKELIGFIKEEEKNTVEYDHLGCIYLIKVNTPNIYTLEDGLISGDWFTKEEIIKEFDTLENWSKMIFSYLLEKDLK